MIMVLRIALVVFLISLSSCGRGGELYLPDGHQQENISQDKQF